MRAEIISTGTELLLGEIVDTNTSFLANQLAVLGVDLFFTSTVGDNHNRLLGVLGQAWNRSELILTTGGLGPTQGDITREAIAGLLGEGMEVNPGLRENLDRFFTERGLEMTPNNLKQATLIPSATAIPNPQGTAPGWWVEKDGRILIAMPGPSDEMQLMWQNEVFPKLKRRVGAVILSRTIKTFGLAESKMDELLADLLLSSNPTMATYAKPDGIYVRITAKAERRKTALAMIMERETAARAILGEYIWGVDDDTLETIVVQLLIAKGLSLAVAESFTGGSLTYILAITTGSHSCFKGGLITTSNEAKVALGLDPNLISGLVNAEVTAAAMASLARHKLNASIGIGIEGHTEMVNNMKLGKVSIAIASHQDRQPIIQSYSGRHHQIIKRAAYYALVDLRQLLIST